MTLPWSYWDAAQAVLVPACKGSGKFMLTARLDKMRFAAPPYKWHQACVCVCVYSETDINGCPFACEVRPGSHVAWIAYCYVFPTYVISHDLKQPTNLGIKTGGFEADVQQNDLTTSEDVGLIISRYDAEATYLSHYPLPPFLAIV